MDFDDDPFPSSGIEESIDLSPLHSWNATNLQLPSSMGEDTSLPQSPLLFSQSPGVLCDPFELSRQQPSQHINGCTWPPYKPVASQPIRTTNQLAHIQGTIMKGLWKKEESYEFRLPVDEIKHKIHDYRNIIAKPMDFTTIKKRLANGWYRNAADCLMDFDLVFENCRSYNPPTDPVAICAQKLRDSLKTRLGSLPQPEVELPLTVAPEPVPKTTKPQAKKKPVTSKARNSLPVKTLTPARVSKNSCKTKIQVKSSSAGKAKMTLSDSDEVAENYVRPGDGRPTNDPLQLCRALIDEFMSAKFSEHATPFYRANGGFVPQAHANDGPRYPVDLITIQTRLMRNQYLNAGEFAEDMRLMFSNCYRCNRPGDPIIKTAQELQRAFEMRYARLPWTSYGDAPMIERQVPGTEPSSSIHIRQILEAPTVKEQPSRFGLDKEAGRAAQIASLQVTMKLMQDQMTVLLATPDNLKVTPKKKKGARSQSPDLPDDDDGCNKRKKPGLTSIKVLSGGGGVQSLLAKKLQKKVTTAKSNMAAAQVCIKNSKAQEGLVTGTIVPQSHAERVKSHLSSATSQLIPSASTVATMTSNDVSSHVVAMTRVVTEDLLSLSCDNNCDLLCEDLFQQYEEKKRLREQVGALRADDLRGIVSIIQEMEGDCVETPDDLEIDFDSMKPSTLRLMESYVAKVTSKKKRPHKSSSKVTSHTEVTQHKSPRLSSDSHASAHQSGPVATNKSPDLESCNSSFYRPMADKCTLSESSSSDDEL